MTNPNRPVYRYAPKSHTYNCPCDRCVQVRRNRPKGGAEMVFPVFFGGFAVLYGIGWCCVRLARAVGTHPGDFWPVPLLIAVIVTVIVANKRAGNRPAKGRLHVEATVPASGPPLSSLPPAPQPPAPSCYHLNAVPVTELRDKTKLLAWLCPDCDEGLPAEFALLARPCCGTFPGTSHFYNCPQAAS